MARRFPTFASPIQLPTPETREEKPQPSKDEDSRMLMQRHKNPRTPVVPYETTGHLRSHPGAPACMQSGARLSLGYRHDCPRPLRGGGGSRSAGGVGLMTGTNLYALETGEGKTPPRQPHPHGDSHHGPQHEDMLARKGRTRGQAGSGTNLVRDERQPE